MTNEHDKPLISNALKPHNSHYEADDVSTLIYVEFNGVGFASLLFDANERMAAKKW